MFFKALDEKIKDSLNNNYTDNFDYNRFGKPKTSLIETLKTTLKESMFKNFFRKRMVADVFASIENLKKTSGDKFEKVYALLNDDHSKKTMVDVIAFKLLGYRYVKLDRNSENYWLLIKDIEKERIDQEFIELGFRNWKIFKYKLHPFGFPIEIFIRTNGILQEFIFEQYKYKDFIEVSKGDYVIDAGGCWGDTALYFANKTGGNGRVYSVEFIPNNLSVLNRNISLNQNLSDIIEVIQKPLWNESSVPVYYKDRGPASRVSFNDFAEKDGVTETLSIDEISKNYNVEKIDFIKMDIEGAELPALNGAFNTIEKFKPKLAIASYHNLNQFVDIPLWINEHFPEYKIYMDHFSIHWEETVIFAKT